MLRKRSAVAAVFLCGMVGISACNPEKSVDPTLGVEVTVDSAAYHLEQIFDWYQITVKSTVVNRSDRDIFLASSCYDGPRLRRADPADNRQLLLGAYVCSEGQSVPPIRVSAGSSFTYLRRMDGSNSSQTRPPITIDDNTGTLVMSFVLTDSTGRRTASIASHSFDVLPPIPPANRDTLSVTSGVAVRMVPDSVIASRTSGDHVITGLNVRMYNRRQDAIGVNPCGWTLEHRVGTAYEAVDQAHCSELIGDRSIVPGDSADFYIQIDDSPYTQTQFNRTALTTGVYRLLMKTTVGGDRSSIPSNTFALFTTNDFRLPTSDASLGNR